MPLAIALSELRSRVTRSSIVQQGLRKIDLNFNLTGQVAGGGEGRPGILNRIFNLGRRLVGFITNRILPILGISASRIFGWLVSGWQAIWQFNWNATDNQLRQQFQSQNIAIASAWGSAFGQAFGWTVGIAIGYGVTLICPVVGSAALAKYVAGEALPEALEELGQTFGQAIRVTASAFASRGVMQAYMGYRKALRNMPRSVLVTLYGEETADFVRNQWGNEGQPNISFATQMEERIEALPPVQEAFWENFFDEAWDGFTEAGYIIANELDAAIETARAGSKNLLGTTKTITVQPDNRSTETYAFTGPQTLVQSAVQTTLNNFRTIHNRDVGQIVGQPAEDWYRARPQRRKLTIVFKELERPPYRLSNGRQPKQASYSIPEPKPNLSWERIKTAARPYTWGKFRATANLTNGRQMAVYGGSAQEAENKLRDLLDLSTCEISTLSISEEKERNPRLRKEATRLYPSTGCLLVRRASVDTSGRTDIDGNTWDEEHIRFDLWTRSQPPEFRETI